MYDPKHDPDPDTDPEIIESRIRIRSKSFRIHNIDQMDMVYVDMYG
jgi:hypothetical protein